MRAIVRTQPVPSVLATSDECNRARLHQNNPDPKKGSFEFAVYKHPEVKRRLEAMFNGKCAYCETYYSASAPVDVEHYRPKSAVAEDKTHPGYWWLAMDWDNLLPSCIDCNRKRKQTLPVVGDSLADLQAQVNEGNAPTVNVGKKDSFPIDAQGRRVVPEGSVFSDEGALLLNPCSTTEAPEDHLAFYVEGTPQVGLALAKGDPPSPKALASIQVYGLNRLGLVQARTRLLRQLEFLGDLAIELGSMADRIYGSQRGIARRLRFLQDRVLAEMSAMAEPEAPYSAMATAWLRRFRDRSTGRRGRV